jgi:hypothetical protein
MESATCSFCSSDAALVPTEECRACWSCARRIAELASKGDPCGIWQTARDADEDAIAVAGRVADSVSGTAKVYGVAVAFREMAMYRDALRAAGKALALAMHAPDEATSALRLIVTPPLLLEGGLGRLARQMKLN